MVSIQHNGERQGTKEDKGGAQSLDLEGSRNDSHELTKMWLEGKVKVLQ